MAGQYEEESAQSDCTTERGEYVIALEEHMAAPVSETGAASKITGMDTVIYETDLSEEELWQLKQSEEAVVEKNFYLFGAMTIRRVEFSEERSNYE